MILAAALVSAAMTLAPAPVKAPQTDAACLHAAGTETPVQRDRSIAAVAATRAINTAQAAHSALNKKYATRPELAGHLDGARYNLADEAEIVPGFKLTLDLTQKGYWFEIVDKTDPCGFRFISNQSGLIFTAQPIR
jgi:hypothetical protein